MAFDESLTVRAPVARCGLLLHGVCDSSAIRLVRHELTRDPMKRQFVYWLTLSSHFPLPAADFDSEGCKRIGAVAKTTIVCQLWTALWPALDGLATVAADTTVPPAMYIIVGDHMPPQLLSEGNRQREEAASTFEEDHLPFSTTEVPFLILDPDGI